MAARGERSETFKGGSLASGRLGALDAVRGAGDLALTGALDDDLLRSLLLILSVTLKEGRLLLVAGGDLGGCMVLAGSTDLVKVLIVVS